MIHGSFVERLTDTHIALRNRLLNNGLTLPPPTPDSIRAPSGRVAEAFLDAVLTKVRSTGLCIIQLDTPLSNQELLALGLHLGTPIPETDPSVQKYAELNAILNIVSQYGHTQDVALQPFASGFLTLHTESSGRRTEEQPRYVMLMCCDAGDDLLAQTVIVPMTSTEEQLSSQSIDVLSRTSYRNTHGNPTIIRNVDRRRVFSFRDFFGQTLEWTSEDEAVEADEVNAAIRELLCAMYSPNVARGLSWSSGMLAIIDNTFYFHGRTASGRALSIRHRHLKRLRIL